MSKCTCECHGTLSGFEVCECCYEHHDHVKQLLVDIGLDGTQVYDVKNGWIKRIYKNGEMALVEWFQQNQEEINGKYVISIITEKAKS